MSTPCPSDAGWGAIEQCRRRFGSADRNAGESRRATDFFDTRSLADAAPSEHASPRNAAAPSRPPFGRRSSRRPAAPAPSPAGRPRARESRHRGHVAVAADATASGSSALTPSWAPRSSPPTAAAAMPSDPASRPTTARPCRRPTISRRPRAAPHATSRSESRHPLERPRRGQGQVLRVRIPTPQGIDGLRVLDLGSGSGRDCYAPRRSSASPDASQARPGGCAAGRREEARESYCVETLGYNSPNMEFKKGTTRTRGGRGGDESVDLIIGNCVVNSRRTSPRCSRRLGGYCRVGVNFIFPTSTAIAAPGGDQVAPVLLGECLGRAMCSSRTSSGCAWDRLRGSEGLEGTKLRWQTRLKALLGELGSTPHVPAVQLPGRLESICEDYGQYVVYKGTIDGTNAYCWTITTGSRRTSRFSCAATRLPCSARLGSAHFDVHGDRARTTGRSTAAAAGGVPGGDGAGACAGSCC